MDFMEKNHRNPSKYVDAERGLRNWVKQQKKLMNAGALEGQRLKMFNELLALGGSMGGGSSMCKSYHKIAAIQEEIFEAIDEAFNAMAKKDYISYILFIGRADMISGIIGLFDAIWPEKAEENRL